MEECLYLSHYNVLLLLRYTKTQLKSSFRYQKSRVCSMYSVLFPYLELQCDFTIKLA